MQWRLYGQQSLQFFLSYGPLQKKCINPFSRSLFNFSCTSPHETFLTKKTFSLILSLAVCLFFKVLLKSQALMSSSKNNQSLYCLYALRLLFMSFTWEPYTKLDLEKTLNNLGFIFNFFSYPKICWSVAITLFGLFTLSLLTAPTLVVSFSLENSFYK